MLYMLYIREKAQKSILSTITELKNKLVMFVLKNLLRDILEYPTTEIILSLVADFRTNLLCFFGLNSAFFGVGSQVKDRLKSFFSGSTGKGDFYFIIRN